MSGYNDKQKALMYDVLVKLVEFRNCVEEYIDVQNDVRVTPSVSHCLRSKELEDCDMEYLFSLDVNGRYTYPIFTIYDPDEKWNSVELFIFSSEKFEEEGTRITLDELDSTLEDGFDMIVSFANDLGKKGEVK